MISDRGQLSINLLFNLAFLGCICASYFLDYFSFLEYRIGLDTVNYSIQFHDVIGRAYTSLLEFEGFACSSSTDDGVLTLCSNLFNFKTAGALYMSISALAALIIAFNMFSLVARIWSRGKILAKVHMTHYSGAIVYIFAACSYLWVSNVDHLKPPKEELVDIKADSGIPIMFVTAAIGMLTTLHYLYLKIFRRIEDIDLGFVLFEDIKTTQTNQNQINFLREREQDYLILLKDLGELKEFLRSEVPIKVNPQHFLSKEVFNMLCNFWTRRDSTFKFASPEPRGLSTGAPGSSAKEGGEWEEEVIVASKEPLGSSFASDVGLLKKLHDDEMATLAAENDDLRRQVEMLKLQANSLSLDKEELKRLNKVAEAEHFDFQALVEAARIQSFRHFNMRIEDLESHLLKAKEDREAAEASLLKLKLTHQLAFRQLTEELDRLRSDNLELTEDIRQLTEDFESLGIENARLTEDFEGLRMENLRMEGNIRHLSENLERFRNENADLTGDIKELIEGLKSTVPRDLDTERSELLMRIRLLLEEASEKDKEIGQMQEKSGQLVEMLHKSQARVSRKKTQVKTSRFQIFGLQALLGSLNERAERAEMSQEELRNCTIGIGLRLEESADLIAAQGVDIQYKTAVIHEQSAIEERLRLAIDRLMLTLADAESTLMASDGASSKERQSIGHLHSVLKRLEDKYAKSRLKLMIYREKRTQLFLFHNQTLMEIEDFASRLVEQSQTSLSAEQLRTTLESERRLLMFTQMEAADLAGRIQVLDALRVQAEKQCMRLQNRVAGLEDSLRVANIQVTEISSLYEGTCKLAERRGVMIEDYESHCFMMESTIIDQQDQIFDQQVQIQELNVTDKRQRTQIGQLTESDRNKSDLIVKLNSIEQKRLMILADMESRQLLIENDSATNSKLLKTVIYYQERSSKLEGKLADKRMRREASKMMLNQAAMKEEDLRSLISEQKHKFLKVIGRSQMKTADIEAWALQASEQLEVLHAKYEGALAELDAKLALEVMKERLLMQNEDLLERLSQRETSEQRLRMEFEDAAGHLGQLSAASESYKETARTLTVTLHKARAVNGKLKTLVNRQESTIDKLTSDLSQRRSTGLSQLAEDNLRHREKIESLLAYIDKAGLQHEDSLSLLVKLTDELRTAEAQGSTLRVTLQCVSSEKAQVETDLQTQLGVVGEQQRLLEAAEMLVQDYETRATTTELELNRRSAIAEDYSHQTALGLHKLEGLKGKIADLEAERDMLRARQTEAVVVVQKQPKAEESSRPLQQDKQLASLMMQLEDSTADQLRKELLIHKQRLALEDCTTQLSVKNAELLELSRQLEDTEELLAGLSADSAASAVHCRGLEAEAVSLKEANEGLVADLAEKTEEVTKLEDSVFTLSRRITGLVGEISGLGRLLAHAGMHQADLESSMRTLIELKESLEVQLLIIQGKLELLQRRGQGKEELELLVAELEAKVSDLEAEVRELLEKTEALQHTAAVLEQDNTALYEQVDALEKADTFSIKLAAQLGMEGEDYKAQLELKTFIAVSMAEEIKSLNQQLYTLETQLEDAQAALNEAESKVDTAERHASAMESRADRLQSEVVELVRQREELKAKLRSYIELDKPSLERQREEALTRLAEEEGRTSLLKNAVEALTFKWNATLMVVEDYSQVAIKDSLTKTDLTMSLDVKLRVIADLEGQLPQHKAKLAALAVEIEELRKDRSELQRSRSEIERLRSNQQDLKGKLTESEMMRLSIASTANELRSQYDDLISERSRGPEEIIIECRGYGALTPFVTPQKLRQSMKSSMMSEPSINPVFEELEQANMKSEELRQCLAWLTEQKTAAEAKLNLQVTEAKAEAEGLADRLKNTLVRVKMLEQTEDTLKRQNAEVEQEKEKYKKGCYSRQVMYKKATDEIMVLKKNIDDLGETHRTECEQLQAQAFIEQNRLLMKVQDVVCWCEDRHNVKDGKDQTLHRLRRELDKRMSQLKKNSEELNDLRLKLNSTGKKEGDYLSALKRIKELEAELGAQRALVQSLLKQMAELEAKYEAQLSGLESERTLLGERLEDEAERADYSTKRLETVEDSYAGELERLRLARQELRQLIEAYEARIHEYDVSLQQTSKKLMEVSGQIHLSQKRIEDLAKEKQIVEDLLKERDRQLQTLRSDLQTMDYDSVKDRAELMQKYMEVTKRSEQLADENALLDSRRQSLEAALETLQGQLTKLKAELLAKEQTLTVVTSKSSDLQRSLRDKSAEVGSLKERVGELSEVNGQLQDSRTHLQGDLEALEAEAAMLRSELTSRANMSQQVRFLEEESARLRSEAAERSQELLVCKTKLQAVRRDLSKKKKAYLLRALVHIYKQSYNIKLAFGYFKLLWTQPDVDIANSADFRNFENLQADKLTDPEIEEGEKILTRAKTALLTENPVKLTFENAGLSESPLAYANVFAFFEDLMDKKYEIDQADIVARREPRSMAEFMLEHLNRKFGLKKLEVRYLCQLMPALHLLYREEQPYGTLFCRLLQVYHPDPVPFELAVVLTRVRIEFCKLMERTSKGRDDRDSKRGQKQISKKHQSMLAYELQACGGEVFLADLMDLVYQWFASDPECGEMFIELLKPPHISQADFVTFLICQRMVTMGKDPSSIFSLLAQDFTELNLERFVTGLRQSLDLWVSVESISLVFDLIDVDASSDVTKEEFSLKIGFDQYYFRARSDDYVVTKCCFLNAFVEAYRVLQTRQAARLLRIFYEYATGAMNLTQFRKVIQIVDPGLTISSIDQLYSKGIGMSQHSREGLDRDAFCSVLLKYSIGFKSVFNVLNLEQATRRRKHLAPDIKITSEGRIISPLKRSVISQLGELGEAKGSVNSARSLPSNK
jgi:chromosome segregation ATPase